MAIWKRQLKSFAKRDWLLRRKKQLVSAAEGLVYALVDDAKKVGVIIEVNAETDFVAKNSDFVAMVDTFAKTVIAENPADVDALLAARQ